MPTSKPTNQDAQRILNIMDDLKEKLTYLSVVTPQVLEGLQSEDGAASCEALGPELIKQFTEQIRLEELYVVQQQQSDGYGHEGETEDVREDVRSLQKNTLELCRKMKAANNVVALCREFQETRPAQMVQFLKTLVDMQELTHIRLTTTVEEERSKAELLEHYKVKETDASKRRTQLEKDLAHIRREKDRSQSQRTEILTKLKADLLDVRENKDERMNALRTRYENRMKEYQDQFNARREDCQKRIDALKAKNAKLRDESQQQEMTQKKNVRRYEKNVEMEIEKYDDEIKEITIAKSEHTDGFKREQKQLEELREHFRKVDAEKDCIEAEEGIAAARKAKLEYVRNQRNQASAQVQAFWRGILQRETYQIMKKSKKKKPNKKGK
jgi:hypothetical protein